MLRKLIKMIGIRTKNIDTICSDWDARNEKLMQQSFDKRIV